MPRVSVVIPAYNAARFIGQALDSVAQQTYRDFEIVVADDGSTDDTAEIAASRPATIVLRRKRGGPAAARNDAIRASAGELIGLLDADDTWHPEKLGAQVERFDREPGLLLVATAVEAMEGSGAAFAPPSEGRVTGQLLEDNFLATSSVAIRRSGFERVGGFDPDPELVSVEDYDLWLRLSLAGPFGAVPRPLVRRREHEANLSRDHLELGRRTLRVIEKFEQLPESLPYAATIARRKAELSYLIARAHLSRGERIEGRLALRRSSSLASRLAPRCLALEALSWLPRSWLLRIHDARRGRRVQGAATADGPR
jgi:glycosyltransferase involved in cell wall biosynthesis